MHLQFWQHRSRLSFSSRLRKTKTEQGRWEYVWVCITLSRAKMKTSFRLMEFLTGQKKVFQSDLTSGPEQLCMKECACPGLWNDRGTERACGRLPLKISPKAPLPSFLMILKRPSRISCPSWYMSRLSKTVTKLCDIISDQTRRTNTCLLYSQSLSSLTGSLTGIKIVFFIKSALTQIIT